MAGPLAVTQSILSSVSRFLMRGGGVPAVHVSPGRATGSGKISRYESLKPARSSAADTGQRSGYFTCGRAAAAAGVQSRCEGELKSPVRNVGTPRAACRESDPRYGRISPSLVARSFVEHLGLRLAVAHQLRAVRARRQVHVADRHHAARANGDVAEADPAALHRVDGIARGDVKGLVGVGHAGRFRDATEGPSGSCTPTTSVPAARMACPTRSNST